MLKQIVQNSRWFVAIFSAFVLYLAIIFYPFIQYGHSQPLTMLQVSYLISTQLGWLGLIALLVMLPMLLLLVIPSVWYQRIMFVIFALTILFLKIDVVVFEQYKFHINGVLIHMFFDAGNEVFNISWLSWLLFSAEVFMSWLLLLAAFWCAKRWQSGKLKYVLVVVWFGLLFYSQALHAIENAKFGQKISQFNNNWPLYYPLQARSFIYKHGLVDRKYAEQQRVSMHASHHNKINYPLNAVEVSSKAKQPNVLFIMVDAWRPDDVTADIMPNVMQFAQQTTHFTQHMSGGNSTRAGMFSLFYSLPATYWNSVSSAQVAPVFLKKLLAANYRMGVFGSAPLTSPPLARTVFKDVNNLRLRTPGKTAVERDAQITQDMVSFLQQKQTKPYFGFLFYDSAHGSVFPESFTQFKPYWQRVDHILLNNNFDANLYHNRYRNSLNYIDSLIKQVLHHVDLSNTIVVITSDHGEEFNDNKQNYWGHAGNYSGVQVHVPLFVHIPNQPAGVVNYQTTHFDVIPTLMHAVFNVQTPDKDYSIGHDLFDSDPARDYFIAGSYYNYAIVGHHQIMVINPGGLTKQMDKQLNPVTDRSIPVSVLQQQLQLMSRFY